jgi:hypothetical protein
VAHGDGERWIRTVERVERQRERAEGPRPARLRESSDLTATRVGDWEWRHDGGTLAGSGLHSRLGDFKSRTGGSVSGGCGASGLCFLAFTTFSFLLLVISYLV